MEEKEAETGSMFASGKILIGMVVVALLAVLIGMGGERSPQDKRADIHAAEQEAAQQADRTAGFRDEDDGR
jgi:hypothetical protein